MSLLWPSDAIWRHCSWSTLAHQVTSHYLKQWRSSLMLCICDTQPRWVKAYLHQEYPIEWLGYEFCRYWNFLITVATSGMASQITDNSIICPTVCSNKYQSKHQSTTLLTHGIPRGSFYISWCHHGLAKRSWSFLLRCRRHFAPCRDEWSSLRVGEAIEDNVIFFSFATKNETLLLLLRKWLTLVLSLSRQDMSTFNFLWIFPPVAVIAFVFIWNYVGVASLVGVGVIVLSTPLQAGLGILMGKLK